VTITINGPMRPSVPQPFVFRTVRNAAKRRAPALATCGSKQPDAPA